ncbi:MAG: hypothetical protein ACFCU5_00510 [Pleurocapsa sp.]
MKRYQQIISLTTILALITTSTAIAQNSNTDALDSCDRPSSRGLSTLKNITKSTQENNHSTVRETSPVNSETAANSANNPIQPSLWWATEQFDPFAGRLVESWLTDTQVQQINLVVNWQLWTFLDYLGRYRFVNQFGTIARKYGYDLNIFNQTKQCLATYKYNTVSYPPKWEINLEQLGKNSLQIEPVNFRNTP